MRARAYSSVMVLASEEVEADDAASDSRCLTTLLLVRDIQKALEADAERAQRKKGARGSVAAEAAKSAANAVASALPFISPFPVEGYSFQLLGEILDPETKALVSAAGVG